MAPKYSIDCRTTSKCTEEDIQLRYFIGGGRRYRQPHSNRVPTAETGVRLPSFDCVYIQRRSVEMRAQNSLDSHFYD